MCVDVLKKSFEDFFNETERGVTAAVGKESKAKRSQCRAAKQNKEINNKDLKVKIYKNIMTETNIEHDEEHKHEVISFDDEHEAFAARYLQI